MTRGMLVAYDADGNIVGTCDEFNLYDEETDEPIGPVDFIATEKAGGKFRHRVEKDANGEDVVIGIWNSPGAVGSVAWPEWIGTRAHEFRVELGPDKRAQALVHLKSGHRRERAAIEAELDRRIKAARAVGVNVVDARDLLGGPYKHKPLDADGRDAKPRKFKRATDILVAERVPPTDVSTDQPDPKQLARLRARMMGSQ